MEFEAAAATEYFVKQLESLPENTRRIIKSKIGLAKLDQFRNKRIHSRQFSHVYRIRLNIENEESRLVYALIGNKIVFACLLDRKATTKNWRSIWKNSNKGFL